MAEETPAGPSVPVAKAAKVAKSPAKKAATAKAPAKKSPAKKAATTKAPAKKAPARTHPLAGVVPTPTPTPSLGWSTPVASATPPPSTPTAWPSTPPPPTPPAAPAWPAPAQTPVPPPPYGYPSAPVKDKSRIGIIVGAIVASVVLLAAGLGIFAASRDKSSSKADYIKDADAVCRPANGPVVAIVVPTSFPELEVAAGTLSSVTTNQLGQLRALDGPGGSDGSQSDAVLSSLDTMVAASGRLKAATSRQDADGTIKASVETRAAYDDASARARQYGFGACAVGMITGLDAIQSGSRSVIKAGLVAKAEALCQGLARQFDDAQLDVDQIKNSAAYKAAFLDPSNRLLSELRALPVPPGDEQLVSDMLGSQQRVIDKAEELGAALDAQDEARYTAILREIATLTTAADAKFDAYGLQVCGSNFGS